MLSTIDVVILAIYLVATIIIGLVSRGKQDNSEDYFTAGGALGGWFASLLVGLSVAATLFSGISFLAFPSIMYGGGIVVLLGTVLVSMPVAYFVLRWFLNRYLQQGVRHPYDSIAQRFGEPTRTTASTMYVLMRIGWMAALIYAPTLAIMAATGLSKQWFWPCVLTIGLTSTMYTVFGGIRGVIITDAMQFVVIALGIALTIVFAWFHLPVSTSEMFRILKVSDRLDILPISLDPKMDLTLWTVVIGVTVANLANYIGDQMSLQRYLATGNTRSAMHAFTVNVVGVVVVLLLLAGVGLMLFTYYYFLPDPNLPQVGDQIFPYFIATQLPVGVSGLLLAAILAATMSSMTSGINALAATITLDLMPRLARPLPSGSQLKFARLCSFVVGLTSTLLAGVVHRLGSLYDLTQIILGTFAGPLLVVVLLSTTHRRISTRGMVVGLIGGCLAGWAVAISPIAALWTAPVAAGLTMLIALVWKKPRLADNSEPVTEPIVIET